MPEAMQRDVRPMVIQCVRAELSGRVPVATADVVADDIYTTIAARLVRQPTGSQPALAVAYDEIRRRMRRIHLAPRSGSGSGHLNPLDGLPELQRAVLTLRLIAGRSVADTAGALDITPDTVRMHQHRALKRLRMQATACARCLADRA